MGIRDGCLPVLGVAGTGSRLTAVRDVVVAGVPGCQIVGGSVVAPRSEQQVTVPHLIQTSMAAGSASARSSTPHACSQTASAGLAGNLVGFGRRHEYLSPGSLWAVENPTNFGRGVHWVRTRMNNGV